MRTEKIDLIHFKCVRCGACCRWEGLVRLDDQEIHANAQFLEMTIEHFIDKYTQITYDRTGLSLIDHPQTKYCIFYNDDNKSCLIQSVKPKQCSAFPYTWRFDGWSEYCQGAKLLKD